MRFRTTLAAPDVEAALAGVHRIDAPTAQDEAEVVALILREAIETPTATAALVTPDRLLARRVSVRLAAMGVPVDDSAGRPFAKTAAGAFLDLVVEAAAQRVRPGAADGAAEASADAPRSQRARRPPGGTPSRTRGLPHALPRPRPRRRRRSARTAQRRKPSATATSACAGRARSSGCAKPTGRPRARSLPTQGGLRPVDGAGRRWRCRLSLQHLRRGACRRSPKAWRGCRDAEAVAAAGMAMRATAAQTLFTGLLDPDLRAPDIDAGDYADFYRGLVAGESRARRAIRCIRACSSGARSKRACSSRTWSCSARSTRAPGPKPPIPDPGSTGPCARSSACRRRRSASGLRRTMLRSCSAPSASI